MISHSITHVLGPTKHDNLSTNYIITLLNWVSHRKCFPNWLKLSVVPKHVCESIPRKNLKINMLLFWLSDTQFYLLELEELYGVCSMGSVYSLTSISNSINVWSTTTFSQFLDIFSNFLKRSRACEESNLNWKIML